MSCARCNHDRDYHFSQGCQVVVKIHHGSLLPATWKPCRCEGWKLGHRCQVCRTVYHTRAVRDLCEACHHLAGKTR